MGLIVYIHRSDYDSTANVFHGKQAVVVTNLNGPFQPDDEMPAAKLTKNSRSNWIIVPDDSYADKDGVQMFGGTYAATSDSRFSEATRVYGAIPIHDRRETWAEYERLSR